MKNTKLIALLIAVSTVSCVSARCWTDRDGNRVCDDRREFRPVSGTLRRTGELAEDTGRGIANVLTLGGVERAEDRREDDIRADERRRMDRDDR